METHYFQRYHSKENVDTANAMLLLSRLYLNSPKSFYEFLYNVIEDSEVNLELKLTLQEKAENSVPDASIMQESFKIVIETKLHNNFSMNQIKNHLESLKNFKHKFLFTLDPKELSNDKINQIKDICESKNDNIRHIHMTFKKLIEKIKNVVDERDIDMQNIIDDYERYCYDSNLIPDDWKRMRLVLSSGTFTQNKKYGVYYHGQERGYSSHTYIGLYKEKSVRAIGKISGIFDACVVDKNNICDFKSIKGSLDEKIKSRIKNAIEEAPYTFDKQNTRFFIVDKFYDTDFKKITPRAPMGSRMFDLVDEINKIMPEGSKIEKLPETSKIAELLKNCTWG